MVLITRTLLAAVALFSLQGLAAPTNTVPKIGDLTTLLNSPLANGPESTAISSLIGTEAGKAAETYLEGEAKKAEQSLIDYIKAQAAKEGKGILPFIEEIAAKFGGKSATPTSVSPSESSATSEPSSQPSGTTDDNDDQEDDSEDDDEDNTPSKREAKAKKPSSSPLSHTGGVDGTLIDTLLNTVPGQMAEQWIISQAAAAAQPALQWAEAQAKKGGESLFKYIEGVAKKQGGSSAVSQITSHLTARKGLGPLALLGGPEGLALNAILSTGPGQQAQSYVEGLAEKAGMDALKYLESKAKASKKSPLQYFTEIYQKFL